jgi:hypothetical protein
LRNSIFGGEFKYDYTLNLNPGIMKFISTRTHGTIDYIAGILLLVSPWLFEFASESISTWIPVLLGATVILYSLFTDYEYGLVPEITMRGHLTLDAIAGIFLAVSPWLFNFASFVYIPHVILGIAFVVLSLTTETIPSIIRKKRPIA